MHRTLQKTLFVAGLAALAALQIACGRQGPVPKADSTPPSVIAGYPANLAVGVDINTSIVVTFSEAMLESSVTASTFQVSSDVSGTVDGSISMDSVSKATFQPTAPLEPSTTYIVAITAGVRDAAGNAMTVPYTSVFTTETQVDATPPYIVTTNPTGSSVGIHANVSVTFSETMKASTITASTFAVSNGTGNIPGTIASYDKNTFIFTPTDTLTYSTMYTVTIDGSVKDVAGNELADAGGNPLNTYAWSFRTQDPGPDVTPPNVLATIPTTTAPAATNVSISTPVVASFSESMLASSISSTTFFLKEQQTGALVAGRVSMSDTATAVFTPSSPLKYETYYLATLATGTGRITDLAGNSAAANSAAGYTWSFQTETIPAYVLTVTKSGNGSGSVTAGLGTLLWSGNTGTASYDYNTSVTLTAAASTGSSFSSWTGCDSTSGTQCTVSMTAARNVKAIFTLNTYELRVTKAGTGSGSVTAGLGTLLWSGNVGTANYDYNTSVSLTAAPSAGSTFLGWSGDCSGTGTCTVGMTMPRNVTATFQ